MSHVTELLERLGSDARLRHASPQELERSLQPLNLSAALRAALLNGEPAHIEQLLGVPMTTCCLIEAVDEVESAAQ
jgi:hypothetical protein